MSIEIKKLEHTYNENTPFSHAALKGIDLSIPEGKVTAIIGQTGSGKSTLVQHLNGLLIPTAGTLDICGFHIQPLLKIKDVKQLRKEVGLVFQFPEYQLFEETIIKDVAFGPKNFGCNEEEATKRAKEALKLVGMDESYFEKSPLELSGGQKRRVAIAGILAMDPKVLVLDEPTAGLDPAGTASMMALFSKLNKEMHKTVLMVTHDMENVYMYCDDVVVLEKGQVKLHGTAREFFSDPKKCRELNILPPYIVRMKEMLNEKGFDIPESVVNMKELADYIAKEVK